MENTEPLFWRSAVDLTSMMQQGEVSAVEVLQAHLDRIDAVNSKVNAIVTLVPDKAMALAKEADAKQAAGKHLGLLHGLPIAHKDLANTAGVRTTFGSPLFEDNVPTESALVVQRAAQAGAVMVGKTNTPEFGAGSQTFNPVFGVTTNPYDTSKTCGGSSGGAAVALATGMVPLADGSDMGGSLRNPASFNNVVGFRPSPGRVPSFPKDVPWTHLSTEGPMARTVDDIALLLAAQAGPDPRSPIALEAPGVAFAPPVRAVEGQLRVAWAPDLGGLPIDPQVRKALAHVPGVFEELGHGVTEACPDLSEAGDVFDFLRSWDFAMAFNTLFETRGDEMKDTLQWQMDRGMTLPMADHQQAWRMRATIFQRVAAFFDDYDVLLSPVAQVPPFSSETEWVDEVDGVKMNSYIEWMRVASDVTIMNCPAMSMPAGFTDDGLPIGLQLVTAPRTDARLLSIAKQFETATNVVSRRPTI